ncbi:tetratricopeptide repeat protein [Acrocarpospora catenulata]|uniref:tetratricopeptide repeat protein n=1 Tax=Acrocarpospora catenulata TaxID=2836182 RepID=UPI001BD94B9C|nr:hypothetical protein [Acrocarpospora catenulata]
MCVEQDVTRLTTAMAEVLHCSRLLAGGDESPGVRLRRGIAYQTLHDHSGALTELSAAIGGELDQEGEAEAYLLRSQLMARLGHYAQAEADATAALRAKLTARGYTARATARALAGDHQGAWTDTERALLLNPGEWEARAVRGRAFLGLRRWTYAVADFDRVIETADCAIHAGELRVDRAEALIALGAPARAAADCGTAMVPTPGCPLVSDTRRLIRLRTRAHLVRARAHLALGDATAALADCFLAAAGAPDEPEVYEIRAAAYELAGCPEEARNDLVRAGEAAEIDVTRVTVS